MLRKSLILLATTPALALGGCVTMVPTTPAEETAMVCNADPAQGYIGKAADSATGDAILKASGARTLRWGPPDTVWTMDFREDRVNVRFDAGNTITQITCG